MKGLPTRPPRLDRRRSGGAQGKEIDLPAMDAWADVGPTSEQDGRRRWFKKDESLPGADLGNLFRLLRLP